MQSKTRKSCYNIPYIVHLYTMYIWDSAYKADAYLTEALRKSYTRQTRRSSDLTPYSYSDLILTHYVYVGFSL